MTDEKNNASDEERMDQRKFLELEYNTLRKEIETRADRHFKIAAGTLIIVPAVSILAKATEKPSGTSTPVGVETPPPSLPPLTLILLLVLPMIVLALYALYVSEHHAIHRCARYIRDFIESQIEPKPEDWRGWESWLRDATRTHEDLRKHEGQQKIAFYLLYVPLYFIAAAEAAVAIPWSEDPFLNNLPFKDSLYTGLGLAIAYLVAGLVVVFVVKFPPKDERGEDKKV